MRLFVALRPPPAMRRALLAAMGGLPGARWQTDEQLHLTLRFIGEVDRHQAADIAASLAAVHHAPFDLKLEAVGWFENRGRAEALWVGVSPHDDVRQLRDSVNRALTRAGIAPEGRAFLPHITTARFSRASAPAVPLNATPPAPLSVTARFDGFMLYESHIGSGGAIYTIAERYELI